LTGKYRTTADLGKSPRGARMGAMLDARGSRILAALDLVSRAHATTPACVAIAWLIARGVTAPIASATNVTQLREILSGATLELTTEEVAALNQASAN
jgi:aryl-alcohol dehydrogenase-like predicted oxidoreductase